MHWALPGKRWPVGGDLVSPRPRARRPAPTGGSALRPTPDRTARAARPVRPRGRRSKAGLLPAPFAASARGRALLRCPASCITHRRYIITMTQVTHLGFPRIGARRELKQALESFWKGQTTSADLHATARELRARHWQLARAAGVDVVPCNDFSLYDHVLDTAVLFDAIPPSHRDVFEADPLDGY